jgi:hypothetical protein
MLFHEQRVAKAHATFLATLFDIAEGARNWIVGPAPRWCGR